MQSPRYVAKYGAIRFLSCPGRAGIVSKFRAVSGTACKMPSPTPPKSAKVELRELEERASPPRRRLGERLVGKPLLPLHEAAHEAAGEPHQSGEDEHGHRAAHQACQEGGV